MNTHEFDASRRPLVLGDPRLTKVIQREPESCATISEYAQKTGIDIMRVLEMFAPFTNEQQQALKIESFSNELFLHTAPHGRPTRPDLPEVAPNLWERLRSEHNVAQAYALWRLYRSLELAGWTVEANPHRILFGLAPVAKRPALGVYVNGRVLPLLVHPTPETLADARSGDLSMYDWAGSGAVGVVCDSGGLDDVITATRRWGLARAGQTQMRVVVLEAPRFAPTVLAPGDASVLPRSVSQMSAFPQR